MKTYATLYREPPATTGGYPNILEEDYHAWKLVSASFLKAARGGLGAARHYLDDNEPKGWSVWFGSYIHALLLEPERVESKGEIAGLSPKANGKTFLKKSIEFGEPIPIAEGWTKMGERVRENIEENVLAADLLDGCTQRELSLSWNEMTGSFQTAGCKARLDGWDRDAHRIVDIKTADKISEFSFSRAIHDFGYHIQAAHYCEGVRRTIAKGKSFPEFWFVVIENKAPFGVKVYRLSEQAIEIGLRLRNELLDMVVMADATDEWGESQDAPIEIGLPAYAHARFTDGEVA